MRFSRLALPAAIAGLLIGGPGNAADVALLAKANEAAEICARHMPDAKATKSAFKAAGFRYEGAEAGFQIYSLNGRRLVAGTTFTSGPRSGCVVSVSKMTPEEAATAIRPWVDAAVARPVKPWGNGLSGTWEGTLFGKPVRLAVIDFIDFGIMRGAAIGVLSAN